MRKQFDEVENSLPVLDVSQGNVQASAAAPAMPPALQHVESVREYGVLARVTGEPRFRLTFGGYAGVVELLVVRVYSRRSSGLLITAGEILPVYSIREPVLERFRSLRRGATVECQLTLRDDEQIVNPSNGELMIALSAGLCHSIRTVSN